MISMGDMDNNVLQQPSQQAMGGLCRDCALPIETKARRCPFCNSPRLVFHNELHALGIAHLDCDAFFAAVEKRDNPALEDKPVIVGGGKRGVVATACYIARINGVGSAMPMFKARKLCPQAVVIKPNFAKYRKVGHKIRKIMRRLTPLVQPVSVDEAFMDLRGTTRLHGRSPAASLAQLALDIKKQTAITVSIGLSHNKFLAKLASDMDKPNGYTVIGEAETHALLAKLPVAKLWGVGKATQSMLAKDGITNCGQLQKMTDRELAARYGEFGLHLAQLARGEDDRPVTIEREAKSISHETTFEMDIKDRRTLEKTLWALADNVSTRCKQAGLAGTVIVLKLKTARFKRLTRNHSLSMPSQMADVLYKIGLNLLHKELDANPQTAYRLIGIGFAGLVDDALADQPDLADIDKTRRHAAERAIDALREKFGEDKIGKGHGL